MREKAPLLLLSHSNAAKSIMRKYEKLSEKCQLEFALPVPKSSGGKTEATENG
jgi:hypothetical protein